jgi:hypothetical protein
MLLHNATVIVHKQNTMSMPVLLIRNSVRRPEATLVVVHRDTSKLTQLVDEEGPSHRTNQIPDLPRLLERVASRDDGNAYAQASVQCSLSARLSDANAVEDEVRVV